MPHIWFDNDLTAYEQGSRMIEQRALNTLETQGIARPFHHLCKRNTMHPAPSCACLQNGLSTTYRSSVALTQVRSCSKRRPCRFLIEEIFRPRQILGLGQTPQRPDRLDRPDRSTHRWRCRANRPRLILRRRIRYSTDLLTGSLSDRAVDLSNLRNLALGCTRGGKFIYPIRTYSKPPKIDLFNRFQLLLEYGT